jgi:hypothetical protein
MLQSRDFNIIQSGAEVHKDGSFVIRDVSPGNYTITSSVDGSAVPMSARQSLQVGSASVEGLRLSPQPGATLRGHLRLEAAGGYSRLDPSQIFLTLQSADDDPGGFTMGDRFTNLAHVGGDGNFVWNDVPPGNYYVQLLGNTGSNEDWFVKSVSAGGREVNDSGISVDGGAQLLDVTLSAYGAVATGAVVDTKGQPASDVVVVAVPELRFRGRTDRYQKTVTDQSGHFALHGLRPGEYTLFAWSSVEGEAYYNPEFLKTYDGQGTGLRVGQGDKKALQLNLIPQTEEQP